MRIKAFAACFLASSSLWGVAIAQGAGAASAGAQRKAASPPYMTILVASATKCGQGCSDFLNLGMKECKEGKDSNPNVEMIIACSDNVMAQAGKCISDCRSTWFNRGKAAEPTPN